MMHKLWTKESCIYMYLKETSTAIESEFMRNRYRLSTTRETRSKDMRIDVITAVTPASAVMRFVLSQEPTYPMAILVY
jgi:hypothetical protein